VVPEFCIPARRLGGARGAAGVVGGASVLLDAWIGGASVSLDAWMGGASVLLNARARMGGASVLLDAHLGTDGWAVPGSHWMRTAER
jgi:hypothetical protein